ncbi:hypothetical protein [Deinococcus ruber]|uniref:hypothetical protein n=1 Tax=Deinococcus ruber TaxID=1848197 RepID=UPI00166C1842|nr:hypothetical protein [Deinococcus ruber]
MTQSPVSKVRRDQEGLTTDAQTVSLNVAQGCSGGLDVRTGTVRSIGAHLIIVTDDNNPAVSFATAQLDSFVTDFDTNTWPTLTGAFGEPSDLDNNGHVVAFVTRAVNELSPPASSVAKYGIRLPPRKLISR